MKAYQNILVGVDFSPASRSALRAAMRLAAFNNAAITVAHIIDPVLASALKRVNGFSSHQVLAGAQDNLARFLAESELGTEVARTHLEVGHPFAGLVAACHSTGADLLVLGTRGNQHGANEVGAVASKCIRKAPADVLLVREGLSGPFAKAMVGVDFSDTSSKAVEAAAQFAACDGAQLDCVFVYQSPLAMAVDYGSGFMPVFDEPADRQRCSTDLVSFVAQLFPPASRVEWVGVVEEGLNIRDALIQHAQHGHADLVVLGTRGRGGLPAMVMGTTAESVIRHAVCSVLAVKPEKVLHPRATKCDGRGCASLAHA